MGIRTGCFVIAILLAPNPLMWVFVALAVVLPYIAVLVANAGRETPRPTTTQVTPPSRPALTGAPSAPAADQPLVGQVFVGDPTSPTSPAAPAPRTAAPRTWESERLRPPSGVGAAAGGPGTGDGDRRRVA